MFYALKQKATGKIIAYFSAREHAEFFLTCTRWDRQQYSIALTFVEQMPDNVL